MGVRPSLLVHALVDMGRGARTDLLITAVFMQGIWGDDLAARIRRVRPEMPVIYTMGLAERYLAAVPTAARSSTLTKPFGAVTLLRDVNNLIPGVRRHAGGLRRVSVSRFSWR